MKRMVGSLRTPGAVLHLGGLAELVAAGTARGDSGMDIADQLLPSVERRDIRLILEATPEDVARAEKSHGAFVRALRVQVVAPLDLKNAHLALAAAAKRVAKQRRVTLKTGLTDPSRPLGAYLLLGPTGVGKTESALSLAAYLFGDDKRLVRFDMAEYAAPGSAQRLLSAGAARGSLTAKVREQPFGVVLLDEVKKADAGVHDLLLQLLGEGRLTDAAGHTVSFRNTVVLLTSNLGADTAGGGLGFGQGGSDLQRHYLSAATQFFRPELLNRLDHVVAYQALTEAEVRTIAGRAVASALRREGLMRRSVELTVDEAVIDRVAQLGFDVRYGARPLKRAIEQHVVAPIAAALASAGDRPPERLVLSVAEDGSFVVAVPA